MDARAKRQLLQGVSAFRWRHRDGSPDTNASCTKGTMAEHIVHIDGVTGSSPVATTKIPGRKAWDVFIFLPTLFCGYGIQEILFGQPKQRFSTFPIDTIV